MSDSHFPQSKSSFIGCQSLTKLSHFSGFLTLAKLRKVEMFIFLKMFQMSVTEEQEPTRTLCNVLRRFGNSKLPNSKLLNVDLGSDCTELVSHCHEIITNSINDNLLHQFLCLQWHVVPPLHTVPATNQQSVGSASVQVQLNVLRCFH